MVLFYCFTLASSVFIITVLDGTSGIVMAVSFQTVILIYISSVSSAVNHLSIRWHSWRDRHWKCSSLGSHHSVWKMRLIPTPLSDGDGYTVCSLCPDVTELCLISADCSFYAHWGSCIYAPQRIWPLCLSHYVPHPGRNAVFHHQFLKFCQWAVTNWTDQGETQENRTSTSHYCLSVFHKVTHPQEGARPVSMCSPLVVWLLSKQHCCIIALCFDSIQSVPQLWLMNQMMCQASGQLMITWDTDRVNQSKGAWAMLFKLAKTWLRLHEKSRVLF